MLNYQNAVLNFFLHSREMLYYIGDTNIGKLVFVAYFTEDETLNT